MKSLLAFYNFTVATIFVLLALLNAHTWPELTAAALFSPLLIYFVLLILPRKNYAVPAAPVAEKVNAVAEVIEEEPSIKMPKFDIDRRLFLKLIASGGISLFFFSLFTHKAEKVFFGSVAKPDNAALPKDTLDDYQIAEIDDSTPAFFGYTNKDGEWFIRKDDESGSFRYVKGSVNFADNWKNRAIQSYDYFSSVF